MQIPVQIKLQQIARVVTRSTRIGRLGALKTQPAHIQLVHERLNDPAHMIGRNKIVQRRREHTLLVSRLALYITQGKCPLARAFSHYSLWITRVS
jgi:hypothetical protein